MTRRPPRGRDDWPARRRVTRRPAASVPFVVEGPQPALFDTAADLLPDPEADATAETTNSGIASGTGATATSSPETPSTRTELR